MSALQLPLFPRVRTNYNKDQNHGNHGNNPRDPVYLQHRVKFLDGRNEIESFISSNLREVMMERGALRSHSLFLPRKADLCFFGCKLLDTMKERLSYLTTRQVEDLAQFLYQERFVVPVMKFVSSFGGTTVLYRFSSDERVVEGQLAAERGRSLSLAREILGTFNVIPSAIAGNKLRDVLNGSMDLTKFGGHSANVQIQFLLLHGFIHPERADQDEQFQVFRTDCNYEFSDLSGVKIPAIRTKIRTTARINSGSEPVSGEDTIPEDADIVSKKPSLFQVEDSENVPQSSIRRNSRDFTDVFVVKNRRSSIYTSPRNSFVNADNIKRSQSHRTPNSAASNNFPYRNRKRSRTLEDLNFAIVEVDDKGRAKVVDAIEHLSIKPLEYQYKPLPSNYDILCMIDNGHYANVYQCQDKESGAIMAVKQVHYNPDSRMSKKRFDALMNELEILKTLKHPNIVSYYGFNSDRGAFNIFMEFVSGGSMRNYIKLNGPLSNRGTAESLAHILLGLSYLHNEYIIHRDLKGANVLRTAQGVLKIADFGCSKKFDDDSDENKAFSFVGSPYWICPEIIRGEGYNNKCDVWAIGATCYEFLTGKPPYFHLDPYPAMYKIANLPMKEHLKFNGGISKRLHNLMLNCFETKPEQRPSVDEMLTLPMFSEFVRGRRSEFYL